MKFLYTLNQFQRNRRIVSKKHKLLYKRIIRITIQRPLAVKFTSIQQVKEVNLSIAAFAGVGAFYVGAVKGT